MSCCQSDAYDQTFDIDRARKQLRRYLRKGPQKTSIPLLNMILSLPLKNRCVLDIGGGIGTISFEALKAGALQVQLVEQSRHYLRIFSEEVTRRDLQRSVKVHYGDFVRKGDLIEQADLVVLDKVICCYPDFQAQMGGVVAKAEKWIAYSLPADVWWVRCRNRLFNQWKKWLGKEFMTYVHPTAEIEQLILRNGFSKSMELRKGSWLYLLFAR